MQFKSPLLAVADMARARAFYEAVLGLRTELDFGANVTLTGGVCLQTKESWAALIGRPDVALGNWDTELYFEEADFDAFVQKLQGIENLRYVHPVREHPWGQRAVRFFDPDRHIIEVGEAIDAVCRRFLAGGMTEAETARRMDVPPEFVHACAKKGQKSV